MAASSSESAKVSLKLLIDTKSKKVLFAEANKEFVDFLFHNLSLPIGTVIMLLKKNSMVGSLGNLYESIENLSGTYMQPKQSKDVVLNPNVPNYGTRCPLLLFDGDVSIQQQYTIPPTCSMSEVRCKQPFLYPKVKPKLLFHQRIKKTVSPEGPPDSTNDVSMNKEFYKCCSSHAYVADDPSVLCPECYAVMNTKVTYVAGHGSVKESEEVGGFVKGVVTYMVMDDLVVSPMSTISTIATLNTFNVKEVGALEEKVVFLELNEGLKLLKASLQCKNVLTIVFLMS
ncbi:uncharacterized protein [Rutidosis leptorrhynchoides]|uniref:uncharacterized protein n=1 Tax=Rutidosis leptorrhynchoides TaxID=125765 RepID=UPI003A99F3B3